MDRRSFLTRLGIGGAAVAAPVGGYALGHHVGSSHLSGDYTASVAAGERRGAATVWWSAEGDQRRLALTFDDGPTEQFTAGVLDVLQQYDVTATFFLIGELVRRHPDLVRRTLDAGHEVGNHTFDHYSAATQAPDEVRRTVERGADAVAELLGERPRWFRPVKGHITGSLMAAVAEFGHDLAMWSVSRGPADTVGSLSLGIVSQLVALMDGRVDVRSEPGVGSVFTAVTSPT